MTPLEYYQEQCAKKIIAEDSQQLLALQHMQIVYQHLLEESNKRDSFLAVLRKPRLVKGLYLWGSVGIGKTFLMDCFYHTLPIPNKMRMHFHQFMQWVHQELTLHQGKKNPLENVAQDLAQKTMLLCFDELFVSDITDAMLLGKLFQALFSRGVCLIATSNTAPDNLYKNGLQRERFLPAIDLLKQHTDVVHITTSIDYRLRHLKEAGVFYTPLNAETSSKMEKSFASLAFGHDITQDPVAINGRSICIKKQAGDIIWFDFSDICRVPRSQQDYLALAKEYRTVFIGNIPVIPSGETNTICLLISLVDVFYDARVRLVLSAAEPIPELYSRGYMMLEYARTHSRLLEMQSEDYFFSPIGQDHTS